MCPLLSNIEHLSLEGMGVGVKVSKLCFSNIKNIKMSLQCNSSDHKGRGFKIILGD
jgi:hypothetical protein